MSATSATGGYLAVGPGPSREAVEDLLGDVVAGVTGLARDLVRARWQPDPPDQPEPEIDWCAIGIQSRTPEGGQLIPPRRRPDGAIEGARVERSVLLEVLASFYGPAADDLAGRLADGLALGQNRTPLRTLNLALVSVGAATTAPDFVGAKWLTRIDLPLTLRQATARDAGNVAVLPLESALPAIVGEIRHG